MQWPTTQDDELVTYGDTVALGLVEHANAIGRITAVTSDGRVECQLKSCDTCMSGGTVIVDADQLLLKISG